jgi:predicted transcriptional regulator
VAYPLTELQLAILDVLWRKGEGTVVEIHEDLRKRRRVAQSTVSTLLARLERKGYVEYRTEGRQYVYRAAIDRDAVQRSIASEFLDHTRPLFRGDPGLIVSHLLGEGAVSGEDVASARAALDELAARLEEGKK